MSAHPGCGTHLAHDRAVHRLRRLLQGHSLIPATRTKTLPKAAKFSCLWAEKEGRRKGKRGEEREKEERRKEGRKEERIHEYRNGVCLPCLPINPKSKLVISFTEIRLVKKETMEARVGNQQEDKKTWSQRMCMREEEKRIREPSSATGQGDALS